MKKRVISFFLVLCMLLALVPVSAQAAEETTDNGAEQLDSFMDLYYTEGLKALFVAYGKDNASVDLSAGKWYGYTVTDGALTRSESVFATIGGTDWTTANGLGYADPDYTHTSNKLTFDDSLVSGNFAVDVVFKTTLRDIASQEDTAETISAPTDNGDGTATYQVKRTTYWRGAAYAASAITVTYSGTPGTVFTPVLMGGNRSKDDMSVAVTATEITIGADGTATATFGYAGTKLAITVPSGVSVTEVSAYKHTDAYEAQAARAFVFGNLYALVWSNLSGTNTWNNGKGQVRWNFATTDWSGHSGADSRLGTIYFGALTKDNYDPKTYDNTLLLMNVARAGQAYTVKYGAQSYALDLEQSFTEEQLANLAGTQKLELLNRMQGTVYAVRVYDAPINEAAVKLNHAADILQYVGASLKSFNELDAAGRTACIEKLALISLADATLEVVEETIASSYIDPEKTKQNAYDALYVGADGSETANGAELVGLFTAFGTKEKSLDLENGNWFNKMPGGEHATVLGDDWKISADGGFGFDALASVVLAAGRKMTDYNDNGISFSERYASFDHFTVESVARFRAVINAEGARATADELKDAQGNAFNGHTANISAFRFGILSFVGFYGHANSGFHLRMQAAKGGWNAAYGKTTAEASFFGYANYIKSRHNELLWSTVTKATAEDGTVSYQNSYNGTVSLSGTVDAAKYATINALASTDKATRFSMFNGAPSTVYAVRIYDGALTEKEESHNRAVDIMAYCGADAEGYLAIKSDAVRELVDATIAGYGFSEDVDALKASVDDVILNLETMLEQLELGKTFNDYDALYVGADGSDTAEGGKLLALYSAMGNSVHSIDTSKGVWFNKLNSETYPAAISGAWSKQENGGFAISYSSTSFDNTTLLSGIAMPEEFADLPDFYVENLALFTQLSDSKATAYPKGYTAFQIDIYGAAWFNGSNISFRPFLGRTSWSEHNGRLSDTLYTIGGVTGKGYAGNGSSIPTNKITLQSFRKETTEAGIEFELQFDGKHMTTNAYLDDTDGDGEAEDFKNSSLAVLTPEVYETIKGATVKNTAGRFSLFNGHPGTVYSVRVYSAPLTTAEIEKNRLADLFNYYQFDIAAYAALSEEGRAVIDTQILSLDFGGDVAETRATINGQMATVEDLLAATAIGSTKTEYDKLYVGADGSATAAGGHLLALYTAYGKQDASVNFTYNKWFDKMGGPAADIVGDLYDEAHPAGWRYLENGGFGYADPDFTATSNMLRFDKDLLGTGNFTVEVVSTTYMRDIPVTYQHVTATEDAPLTFVENADGTRTYTFVPTTNWRFGQLVTFTFSGAAGDTFTPAYSYMNEVTLEDGTKEWQPHAVEATAITLGEDGIGTGSFYYKRNQGVMVTVPADVTVVAAKMPLHTDRYEANANSSFVFGSFFAMTWTNLSGSNTHNNGFGTTRWYVGNQPWTGSGIQWKDTTVFPTAAGKITLFTVTREFTEKGVVHTAVLGGLTSKMDALDPAKMPTTPYGFQLFHGISSDVYAVRVYDVALTQSEVNYNHMIDLLANADVEIGVFTSLETTLQSLLVDMMASTALTADTADFLAVLEDTLAMLTEEPADPDEFFYVSDGLVGLYTAFDSLESGYVASVSGVTWINMLNRTEKADLYGNGWFVNEQGGFTIERTYAEYKKDHVFGIRFDYDLLPDDDYTVELTLNPVGIHDVDENGNKVRYVDDHSTYGTYADYGFILGPLRTMSFDCIRPEGKDGQLEKRWLYLSQGCWHAWGSAYSYTPAIKDTSWSKLDVDEIVNFAITMDEEGAGAYYNLAQNGDIFGSYTVPFGKHEFIDKEAVEEQRFELFNHVAGTVYAIRIYNRALTEAELVQNRVADMIYYYDLDTSVFELAIGNMSNTASVYAALDVLDYDMTREEAQEAFDSRLSAIWLMYSGVSARNDGTDAIRYYFDLNMAGVNNMLAGEYKIDIGAVINIGREQAPELFGYYDYRVSAFNETAGCVQGYFVDEDTFCVTVVYDDPDIAATLTNICVRGYVYLQAKTGEEMLFYVETAKQGENLHSLFDTYKYLLDTLDFTDIPEVYEFLTARTEETYVDEIIWVDSLAVSGGNGSEQTPFVSFEDAIAALKDKAGSLTVPTNITIRLKDGEYPVYEVQKLSASDIAYPYCNISIEAVNEAGATLTTTVDMDASGFTAVPGRDNIYAYQFDKDENGAYPAFRYLFVDGARGQTAAQGSTTARNEDQTFNTYERTIDGIFETVKALYQVSPDTLRNEPNPYPETRPSLRAAYETYKQIFLAYADQGIPASDTAADPTSKEFIAQVGEQTMAEGKIYLPESLVGGFSEYVEERIAGLAEGSFDEATTYRTVLEDVGILMHIVAQWNYNIMHIVGIDYDDYLVDDNGDLHYACYMKLSEYKHYSIPEGYKFADRPVYLTDSLDFMDEEGEFYYDEVGGTVYYYTEGDVADHTFAYPTLDNLLVFDGMSNVTLWGLRLTGVDDYYLTANGLAGTQSAGDKRTGDFPTRAAIYVANGCKNMTIDSCVIEHVGCEGITMRGRIEDLTITYCTVYNTGASGIRVADRSAAWNETCGLDNVTITENYLEEIGYVYRNASALHLGSNRNLILANNTIHDTSYSAVSIGWRWSLVPWTEDQIGHDTYVNIYNADIYGNYIYDFMTETADGGAIYMLGANADATYREYFNYIHDNYIVFTEDTGNGRGGMVCGIYFDGSCSNWHCYNNIVVEQSAAADIEGTPLNLRRRGSTFIYVQHIDSQLTHNILLENNIALNVRYAAEAGDYRNHYSYQKYEIYRTYIVADRNIVERSTRYINGVKSIPAAVEALISSAGCWQEPGDASLLYGNDY